MSTPVLDLASIAYDTPWAVEAQIGLLRRNLTDAYVLTVFDNSLDPDRASEIDQLALESGTRYVRVVPPASTRAHALNLAARDLAARSLPYCAFLDHDLFPVRETSLVSLIHAAGVFGLARRASPGAPAFLWPGFACFSRSWLGRIPVDFRPVLEHGRPDGPHGPLAESADWSRMPELDHAYRPVRDLDDEGVESWAVELIGDWLHVMNASGGKPVRAPDERDRLVRELVARLQ